jgi:hypothetical protein
MGRRCVMDASQFAFMASPFGWVRFGTALSGSADLGQPASLTDPARLERRAGARRGLVRHITILGHQSSSRKRVVTYLPLSPEISHVARIFLSYRFGQQIEIMIAWMSKARVDRNDRSNHRRRVISHVCSAQDLRDLLCQAK